MSERDCKPRPMTKRDLTRQAELFKVMADPHRLRILSTIARSDEEVCVCDLTAELPLEQPTVSHHLRVLRETGLVLSERRGTWVYYRIAPRGLEKLHDAVDAIEGVARRLLRRTG
jgi:ArsR family transcriptional regulator